MMALFGIFSSSIARYLIVAAIAAISGFYGGYRWFSDSAAQQEIADLKKAAAEKEALQKADQARANDIEMMNTKLKIQLAEALSDASNTGNICTFSDEQLGVLRELAQGTYKHGPEMPASAKGAGG
ncbi:MAG TPA: hypothetical protein VE986_04575 [Hyphomicrobiales bacterium]|nr:hypothetical protein [Hyphomicrobiales bacterium]